MVLTEQTKPELAQSCEAWARVAWQEDDQGTSRSSMRNKKEDGIAHLDQGRRTTPSVPTPSQGLVLGLLRWRSLWRATD